LKKASHPPKTEAEAFDERQKYFFFEKLLCHAMEKSVMFA